MKLLFCGLIPALVIGLASILGAPVAAAQQEDTKGATLVPELDIAGGAGEELGPFSVSRGSFDHVFSLISKNDVAASNVSVELIFIKGPDGVTAAKTEIQVNDSRNRANLGEVQGNSLLQLDISATLPMPGEYRFALVLRDKATKSYLLTINRESPQIKLLEVGDGDTVNLEATSRNFRRPLTIRAESSVPAHDVVVAVSPLSGPGGTVEVSLGDTGSEIQLQKIKGLHIASFPLAAELPEAGEFHGIINISYEGEGQSVPIKITRTLPPSGLVLSALGVGQNPTALLRSHPVELGITVRESQGRSLSLKAPFAAGLTRQIGDRSNIAAVPTSTTVFLNNEPFPVGSVELAPAGAANMRMTLTGLDVPGLYSGRVVLPVVDGKPEEVDVSFNIRRPLIWVAGPILVGVLLSLLLRLWATHLRPRIRASRQVLARVQMLDQVGLKIAPARADEETVIEAMRRPLEIAYRDLRLGDASDASEATERFDVRYPILAQWITLSRQVEGLPPVAAVYAIRAELEAVSDYLTKPDPGLTAEEARKKLGGIPAQIKTALEAIIDRYKSQMLRISDGLDDAGRHRKWVDSVDRPIAEALQDIAAGAFTEASGKVDSARFAAACILADDLSQRLEPLPEWLSPPLLERIVFELDAVGAAQHAGAAVPPYRSALALYLEPLSKHLIGQYRELISRLEAARGETRDPLSATAITVDLTAIYTNLAALEAVPGHLGNDDLATAKDACDFAQKQLADLSAKPHHTHIVVAASATLSVAKHAGGEILAPNFLLPIPDFPHGIDAVKNTSRQIRKLENRGDWAYQISVSLITVVVGVYVLWGGKADWGSETDLLLALLWGLGLHSLTMQASSYAGLDDLASKLR